MRLALAVAAALLLLPGCGLLRVDDSAVQRLPLESKLDLIEAENDLFIAVDAVDEAANRVIETKEDYKKADNAISEAGEALSQAEQAKDQKLIDISRLSVTESRQRRDFLDSWEDVMWAQLDVEKAKLELARGRYEKARAQAVKKANVEGAQKIKIEDYDRQVAELEATVKKRVADAAKALTQKLTAVEEELYQTKNRASEDPLNFPIKLNNKLAHVLGVVEGSDNPPTQQSYMVYEDVATRVNGQLKTLEGLMNNDLAAFNKLIHDANVPAIQAPAKK